MNHRKQVEMRAAKHQTKTAHGTLRPQSAKVFEMGNVSVETKGTVAGLEQGLTPRF